MWSILSGLLRPGSPVRRRPAGHGTPSDRVSGRTPGMRRYVNVPPLRVALLPPADPPPVPAGPGRLERGGRSHHRHPGPDLPGRPAPPGSLDGPGRSPRVPSGRGRDLRSGIPRVLGDSIRSRAAALADVPRRRPGDLQHGGRVSRGRSCSPGTSRLDHGSVRPRSGCRVDGGPRHRPGARWPPSAIRAYSWPSAGTALGGPACAPSCVPRRAFATTERAPADPESGRHRALGSGCPLPRSSSSPPASPTARSSHSSRSSRETAGWTSSGVFFALLALSSLGIRLVAGKAYDAWGAVAVS